MTGASEARVTQDCPFCGAPCRVVELGKTEAIPEAVPVWMCSNSPYFGGSCPDRNAYLTAAAWNTRAPVTAWQQTFPIGCEVRKKSGPEWLGKVVGYYSSSFTPEGLVIECTAPGALGQVHVEPAKRMERAHMTGKPEGGDDEGPCTTCWDTGITQSERECPCGAAGVA